MTSVRQAFPGRSRFWDSCFQSPLLFRSSSINIFIYCWSFTWLQGRRWWVTAGIAPNGPVSAPTSSCDWTSPSSTSKATLCLWRVSHSPRAWASSAQRRARAQLPRKNSLFNSLQRQAIGVSTPPYSELLRVEFLSTNQTWEGWRATCCRTESSYRCSQIF